MNIQNTVKKVITEKISGSINIEFTPEEFCYLIALCGSITGTGPLRRELTTKLYNYSEFQFRGKLHESFTGPRPILDIDENSFTRTVEKLMSNLKTK